MGYYGGGGCGFRGTHLMALRLLQPEAHVHLAIHRRRRGEVLLRLLTLAHASVELAEAEVFPEFLTLPAYDMITAECLQNG